VSERRTTSVLFGDLVSFTTLSEQRDPEQVRELLSSYFAVARTVVGRYGGTIEKFIGDAVMAVWGVPIAHEDDAERAVRAGMDLVAEVAALGLSVGAPGLAMRVGVVTGSVAVTLGAVNEGMVAGDAVNTAARVQSAAEPGTVWVDSETRGLTAAAVAFTDMGDHVLKGKAEPARLFRADAVVAARGGAQRVDGLEAPMTGRETAMRQVKELFHTTEQDGRARLVVVKGVAGIGKSRMGWEFEKYVDGLTTSVRWHRGRSLSYGDGVGFWSFAEMVRSRLGLMESDDREEVDAKVREGVAAVSQSPEEAAWLTPRIGALLTGGDRVVAFERTDLFAAWTTFLERVGDDKPVVLLFEDAQHADAALLDLIEHLLETSRARLFVLVLARPELLDRRPSLVVSRRATVIDLEPLDDQAMTALVGALVDDLPVKARNALVSRAEGVPLYAVETVRSLIDRDAVQAREGHYVFVDVDGSKVDLEQLAAPTSLQTLIAARLDALSPLERRAVQDASVLGLSFREEGLMALCDLSQHDLDNALDGLVRKGVVETQVDPRSPELGSYRFLQALVRQVAYSTLSRKDRRSRHLAAATHFEGLGQDVADAWAGIIAQHLLDALDASTDDDPERGQLAARTRALLRSAAARADSLGSPAEALRCYTTVLNLDPLAEDTAEVQAAAAEAAVKSGELVLGESLAAQAIAGLRRQGKDVEAAQTTAMRGRALLVMGRPQDALDLLQPEVERLQGREGFELAMVKLVGLLSSCYRVVGQTEPQQRWVLEGIRIAERIGDPGELVKALGGLAIMLGDVGCPITSRALLERGAEMARENHLITELGRTLSNLLSEGYLNDLHAATALATEALDVSRRAGDNAMTETALLNASFTRWLAGDWTRLLDEAAEWIDNNPESATNGCFGFLTGLVHQAQGRPVMAQEFPSPDDDQYLMNGFTLHRCMLTEALDGPRAAAAAASASFRRAFTGDLFDDLEVFWAPVVELQLRAGEIEEAASLLAVAQPLSGVRARTLTRAQRPRLTGLVAIARGGDPERDLRTAEEEFAAYGAPFYVARTRLELGLWLRSHGRDADAAPLLAKARTGFEELGAAGCLAEMERLPVTVS
jgi:class 3 adenylate cyclase/tetratricopeptide (TPR) repeat protein